MTDEGDVPEIAKRLARMLLIPRIQHPLEAKRVRLAVTPAEYEEIRQFCLATYGEFFSRIRGVPLVIEEQPDDPPLAVETSTGRRTEPLGCSGG